MSRGGVVGVKHKRFIGFNGQQRNEMRPSLIVVLGVKWNRQQM
jgi:hypothetical protein